MTRGIAAGICQAGVACIKRMGAYSRGLDRDWVEDGGWGRRRFRFRFPSQPKAKRLATPLPWCLQ